MLSFTKTKALSVLALFLLIPAILFSEERLYRFGETILKTNPDRFPDDLPPSFFYPGASLKLVGISKGSGYVVQPQGAVYMESNDDLRTVDKFYSDRLRESSWKIIQSQRDENKTFLMAESPFRKVATIVIVGQENATIRIYFRKSGGDDS